MTGGDAFILIIVAAALVFTARIGWRRWKRARLMQTPLTDEQRAVLKKRIPFYSKLPVEHCARLEGLINRFLDEITLIGQEDLDVTEDVKLVIAAQACLLIVGRPGRWFQTLKTVLIYPSAFESKIVRYQGHVEQRGGRVHAGESWMRGPVVLAWDQSLRGALIDDDGHNVVMHEFAHQLDEATGVSDGAPLLDKDQNAGRWARVFQDAYERLQQNVAIGRSSVFDAYGATAPAEFFAVAVETLFVKPREMQREEPAVYEELSKYFGLNPAQWRALEDTI
jgi:Mlc titration factor MtfA (ptsG expression regulator)